MHPKNINRIDDKMKEEIFNQAFYELELFTNKYIAFAVKHTCLSKYIEKTTQYSSQTVGECVKFNCPLCGENCYIYVNDANGTFYTTKCNTAGNIFSLKRFFEKKTFEEIATDFERLGKSLFQKFFPAETVSSISGRRFRVGLSYASEYRSTIVSNIVDGLLCYFNKKEILYDEFLKEEFSILDLDDIIWDLFKNECDLIVVFLCEEYKNKSWPRLEWEAIKSFQEETKNSQRVYLFRLDNSSIPGFNPLRDGYTFISSTPSEISNAIKAIKKRYDRISSSLKK